MEIGKTFRYARPYNPTSEIIDSYPNYFHATFSPNQKLPLLEGGINPIRKVKAQDGIRRPAILISSSPHKIGSYETPWQDFFDTDNGHIRYFGDNKEPGKDPSLALGNKVLLEAYKIHSSLDYGVRKESTPIIFFERVSVGHTLKGYVRFQGFGIITRVEMVTQYDRKNKRTFPNYVFNFTVLSLAADNEVFNWEWITARGNLQLTLQETIKDAPRSWTEWIKNGPSSIERYRRRVSKLQIEVTEQQKPEKGSREEKALNEIYTYYSKSKHERFEALAAIITERVIVTSGGNYKFGWITPPAPDGGADFIGRLDIGSGFGVAKLVILGQAKCEKLNTPTSGSHIARTIARLRRGWVGVYVTTSYFSNPVQREIIEDDYPLVMINGLRLAREVIALAHERGDDSVLNLLEHIDKEYEDKIQVRRPEEILRD